MIDKRELRVGNKVRSPKHNLEIATIQGITTNDIVMLEEVSTYDFFSEIEPIQITTEWLLKLGFTETNSYDSKKRTFKLEGFNQLSDYGGQLITIPEGGFAYLSCGYYENEIDCPYIHRLQNLYFALSGEELTIKELQP